MSEIVVKNNTCKSCGTDVRKGALFCYHCGDSLAPETVVTIEDKITTNGDGAFEEKIREIVIEKNELKEETKITDVAVKSDVSESGSSKKVKLESAANLRKRPKKIVKKEVKIVWKEYENAANVWFITIAVLLSIAVVAIVWLALYLK